MRSSAGLAGPVVRPSRAGPQVRLVGSPMASISVGAIARGSIGGGVRVVCATMAVARIMGTCVGVVMGPVRRPLRRMAGTRSCSGFGSS